MACHFLLQWIFQTHGLNPHLLCLLHWQAGSLPLHRLGSPARLILANKYTQRTSPILCFSHSLFTIFTLIFKMSTRSSHNIILRQKKERGGLYYLYLFLFYWERKAFQTSLPFTDFLTSSNWPTLYHMLGKVMAPHSSTLAWKIPWREEPGRLQSMGSLRVGHDWVTSLSLFTFMHWRRKWQPTPVFLPGESQEQGSHRARHDWSNLA